MSDGAVDLISHRTLLCILAAGQADRQGPEEVTELCTESVRREALNDAPSYFVGGARMTGRCMSLTSQGGVGRWVTFITAYAFSTFAGVELQRANTSDSRCGGAVQAVG